MVGEKSPWRPPTLVAWVLRVNRLVNRTELWARFVSEKTTSAFKAGHRLLTAGHLLYFITPRCAIPILSRVLFFTRYISSA